MVAARVGLGRRAGRRGEGGTRRGGRRRDGRGAAAARRGDGGAARRDRGFRLMPGRGIGCNSINTASSMVKHAFPMPPCTFSFGRMVEGQRSSVCLVF